MNLWHVWILIFGIDGITAAYLENNMKAATVSFGMALILTVLANVL